MDSKPATPSQVSYLRHLLKQTGAEEPVWETLTDSEASALIDGLKAQRGKPVWYGNGQFSHWEKGACWKVAVGPEEMSRHTPFTEPFDIRNYMGGPGPKEGWKPAGKEHGFFDYVKRFGGIWYKLMVPESYTSQQVYLVPSKYPMGGEHGTPGVPSYEDKEAWKAFYATISAKMDIKGLTVAAIENKIEELVTAYKETVGRRKRDTSRWGYRSRETGERYTGDEALRQWRKEVETRLQEEIDALGKQGTAWTTEVHVSNLLENYSYDLEGASRAEISRMVRAILETMAKQGKIEKDLNDRLPKWYSKHHSDQASSKWATRIVARFLRQARDVRILVDQAETDKARERFHEKPDGEGSIVGTFESSVSMYRIMDGEELRRVVRMGKIVGGFYSVKAERAYGASWGENVSEIIAWGNRERGHRLGDDLFLAKIDASGKRFFHMNPKVPYDPKAPEQTYTMDVSRCNTGLGCSVIDVAFDEVSFYRVDASGQMSPISDADIRAYVSARKEKVIELRQVSAVFYHGTIFGVDVYVVKDQTESAYRGTWSVVNRDEEKLIIGAKSEKIAIDHAAKMLRYGRHGQPTEDLLPKAVMNEWRKRQRKYSYDRRMSKTIDLGHYGLDGLAKGESVTLYHGTTRSFTSFDMGQSRIELVDKFYGAGIFLTPSKQIAEQYANANRNIGLEPSIIGHLKTKNRQAGEFMEMLYKHGKDAWDTLIEEVRAVKPKEAADDLTGTLSKYLGVSDPNTIDDVCGYIVGSKVIPLGGSSNNIFDTSTGAPHWLYDSLDELGLDSTVYRPKVYTCSVRVKNPLLTSSKSQAKAAKQKGYDSVVYYGSDLVGGVPEVAVFNASDVKISHVEVV